LAVLTSAVGVYYYFKVIIAMYFRQADHHEPIKVPMTSTLVIVLTAIITLILGIVPGYVAEMFTF
jgi:NADH-quinone oxidoreductase subunit N